MANIKISELNELGRANRSNDDYVPIVDSSADETKKISIKSLIQNNEEIIAVTSTAPSEYNTGDKYYNTTENKIYTATSGGWTNPETPIVGIFYVILEDQETYTYDFENETLVSVGGGSGGETLPVGSEIDFDGQVSDIPTGWEQVGGKTLVAYELYESETDAGTASSIQLSDSIANYKYIEIHFRNNDGADFKGSQKINVTRQTIRASLIYNHLFNNEVYTKAGEVTLSGTTLSFLTNYQLISNNNGNNVSSGTFVYVTKVVGYKEV